MAPEEIRRAQPFDYASILQLARWVAREPDAFCCDATACDEELSSSWLPDEAHGFETFVYCVEDGTIAGVYTINPASGGRGSHVAHGSYMVSAEFRGQGLGKHLVDHSLEQAKLHGYTGMRINMVVSTNAAALRVCQACGFEIIGTVPQAFRHPVRGLVDTHIMFHGLDKTRVVTSCSQPALSYPCQDGVRIAPLQQMKLKPVLGEARAPGSGPAQSATFTVEPALPEGLELDQHTGVISGAAVRPQAPTRYIVTAKTCAELIINVEADEESVLINEDFAKLMETVTKVEDLLPEPSRHRAYGDWMMWMVHRAYLNDPSLTEFDFTNMRMPPPHLEERIAPKLMAAMKTNTHIEVLALANSNVQKVQGFELAAALRQNCTLRVLNLESNHLDSASTREIALAVRDNPECRLESIRFCHQKQMGQFFGRPTEEAVGQMMEKNALIVKLGFECDDAHWRNLIDRALLRNNDAWRRRPAQPNELPSAEERSLGQLVLKERPAGSEVPWCGKCDIFRSYVAQTARLPTVAQLQSCAKNQGAPLPYTEAAPLVRECRSWLLDAAVGLEVVVLDAFGTEQAGRLTAWAECNDNWSLEVVGEDGKRFSFRSAREPSFAVSAAWAQWMHGSGRFGGA